MTQEEKVASFVKGLKDSGIQIFNEHILVERLEKTNDVEVELIKVAQNNKASGVTFYAESDAPASQLTKVFIDHDLDGFTFKNFVECLRVN